MVTKDFLYDAEFGAILKDEIKICNFRSVVATEKLLNMGEKIYNIIWCLFEVAKSSFVSRSYNTRYGLTTDTTIYESVGAHTNLATAIASHAFWFYYGYCYSDRYWTNSYDGYTHQEVSEALRIHDLCENLTGDIPDNGNRDEARKNSIEMEYYSKYMAMIPIDSNKMASRVLSLLKEMQEKSTDIGRLLFLSDKISALIATLCLDSLGRSPMMAMDSPHASERDRLEMEICDKSIDGKFRASEMWAIDYFKMRNFPQYDDTAFFTALVIMATLVVNDAWYEWRFKDYEA